MITSTKTPKSIKAKSPKTPKALKALISLLSISVIANAGVPVARTVDVSATIKPIALECYAGETLDLSLQLAFGGAPISTPSAAATIYWQTNGMAGAWWQTNLACSATGLVSGQWQPALPFGRVWFFVGVESSGLNYRIAGQCAILQSPGGSPSTAVLPPPGGTLNLGDYTIIGAPWITSADSAAAIASATAPIEEDVASLSSQLSLSSQASSNYTASVAGSVAAAAAAATNYTDLAVAAAAQAATNYTAASVSAAAQQSSADLAAASNTLAQATAALSQTVAANAQQSAYDLAATSNTLAQSTTALSQTVAANAQQASYDLAAASNALAQATAALAQTVADNAQQATSDLVSATNGIPEEIISATNALNQSLAPTISSTSNALAQATTDLAQKVDGLAIITATSNTAYRLMSLDGQTYQDATGTVWHTETTINTSQWHVVAIAYTNGTTVATNEIPGISSWSIDGDYLSGDPPEWIWTLRVPAGGSEYAQIGGAEDATPADMNLEFVLSGGDISSLSFARTNTVSHYWSPVDHVLYSSSGGGGSGLTTNDVCNIVTNEVDSGYGDWVFDPVYWEDITAPPTYSESEGFWSMSITGSDMYALGGPNATRLEWHYEDDFDGEVLTVSTRQVVRVNALGLAMEKDLPQKTPVGEILFNGADGKVYHLRIGAGGSIDIYTEVSP